MEPGTYYVGDLSYITKGHDGYVWIEKVWDAFYQDQDKAKLVTVDGITLFLGQTYGGDGIFDGFYVDSGTIAVIKIDNLLTDNRFRIIQAKGSKILTFQEPFFISYHQGNFKIGDIRINTSF